MIRFHKHLLATTMSIALLSPVVASTVMADEDTHQTCNSNTLINAGSMGMVNEQILHEHMTKIEKKITKMRHGRGPHLSKNRAERKHLSEMKTAMQELHDLMYAEGCKEALHGVSLEARVDVMKKHMEMMESK